MNIPDKAFQKAMAEAWEQGAYAAWEKSNNQVNGETYFWAPEGAPANPYEENS